MATFSKDNIRLDQSVASKDDALADIAAFAEERGYTTNPAGVVEGIRDREALMSTALMDGIGIPHAKHAAIDSAALLVTRYDSPIEWGDGESIVVTLAMLVPEGEGSSTHLALLAQVSRALIDDELRAVLVNGDTDEIYEALSSRIG